MHRTRHSFSLTHTHSLTVFSYPVYWSLYGPLVRLLWSVYGGGNESGSCYQCVSDLKLLVLHIKVCLQVLVCRCFTAASVKHTQSLINCLKWCHFSQRQSELKTTRLKMKSTHCVLILCSLYVTAFTLWCECGCLIYIYERQAGCDS